MAIRFDSEFNAKIANEVRNYNKRRDRAIKQGFRNVPPALKVSDLKSRYTTRLDLEHELQRLRDFNREDLAMANVNKSGVRARAWEIENYKVNLKPAKEYFEKEYKRIKKRVGKFPGERMYLDNVQAKLSILNVDIEHMDKHQFQSAKAIMTEFQTSAEVRKAQYRGFLSEVDWLMEKLGVSNEKRDAFFKKFETLTPQQFLYAYDNNDIIARIYGLYHKNDDSEAYITDEENAEYLVDELIDEADMIVTDAKFNSD